MSDKNKEVYVLVHYWYSGITIYGVVSTELKAKRWRARERKKSGEVNYDYLTTTLDKVHDLPID